MASIVASVKSFSSAPWTTALDEKACITTWSSSTGGSNGEGEGEGDGGGLGGGNGGGGGEGGGGARPNM